MDGRGVVVQEVLHRGYHSAIDSYPTAAALANGDNLPVI